MVYLRISPTKHICMNINILNWRSSIANGHCIRHERWNVNISFHCFQKRWIFYSDWIVLPIIEPNPNYGNKIFCDCDSDKAHANKLRSDEIQKCSTQNEKIAYMNTFIIIFRKRIISLWAAMVERQTKFKWIR